MQQLTRLQAQVAQLEASKAGKAQNEKIAVAMDQDINENDWENEETEEKNSTWNEVLKADKVWPTSGVGTALAGLLVNPPTASAQIPSD